jgi:8-oxo-dGTP pyrophosphatase MutT (NUDIX family)
MEQALWAFLRRLISDHLAFLRHWFFFAIPDDSAAVAKGAASVIECRGPLPTRKRLSLAKGLLPGHVYGLPKGGEPISLNPFGLYAQPVLQRTPMVGESALCRLSEDLLLLTYHDSRQAFYQGGSSGVVIPRNDLADAIGHARADALSTVSKRWKKSCWGYACLNVEGMRDLNRTFGFAAVDRLLSSVDQAAAAFAAADIPSAPCGAPKLFPYWNQADTLVLPFTYDPSSTSPSGMVSLLMATLSTIIATALHDWGQTPSPRFNVLLNTSLWRQGDATTRPFETVLMDDLGVARQTLKTLRLQETVAPVLWLERAPRSSVWHYHADPGFSRTSTAAFGLLRRCVRGESQFFLCWNPTHGGLNLPGGHMERQDADSPQLTMARELWEELGLTVNAGASQALFDGPLRAVRESKAGRPLTAYAHHFFLLDASRLKHLKLAAVRGRWVSSGDLQRGVMGAGRTLCPFPLELLQPLLPQLETASLPLPARDYSDCIWQPLPCQSPPRVQQKEEARPTRTPLTSTLQPRPSRRHFR